MVIRRSSGSMFHENVIFFSRLQDALQDLKTLKDQGKVASFLNNVTLGVVEESTTQVYSLAIKPDHTPSPFPRASDASGTGTRYDPRRSRLLPRDQAGSHPIPISACQRHVWDRHLLRSTPQSSGLPKTYTLITPSISADT